MNHKFTLKFISGKDVVELRQVSMNWIFYFLRVRASFKGTISYKWAALRGNHFSFIIVSFSKLCRVFGVFCSISLVESLVFPKLMMYMRWCVHSFAIIYKMCRLFFSYRVEAHLTMFAPTYNCTFVVSSVIFQSSKVLHSKQMDREKCWGIFLDWIEKGWLAH
jgi:hypothetical protein